MVGDASAGGGAATGPRDSTVERAGAEADQEPGATGVLLKRMVVYVPGSVGPAVLALVTSMVFTRIFTAAEFGMFSLAAIVVAVPVKVVSTTWLVQSVAKFLPPVAADDERRTVLDAVVLTTALIVVAQVILGAVAYAVGHFVLAEQWRSFLLPAVLFVITTSLFEILSALFSAEARASAYTAFKLSDSILTLTLRLIMVSGLMSMDVTLMIWSVVISNGLLVPLMWRRVGLTSPLSATAALRSEETKRLARSFVGFGLPMTLWLFASILLDVGDRWVIKVLLGSGAVGIYDASYRLIAGLAVLMIVPVTITVHPYVMGLVGTEDTTRISRVIGVVVDNLLIVAIFSVGLTFVLRRDIGLVLLGSEFREGSKIMPAVLAGVFLANIGTFAHKPFEIVGRTRPMVLAAFAAAAVNLALDFLLIPFMGYVGAAYATLISYLFYSVSVGSLGRRIIPWRMNLRRVLGQGAVIVAAFVVIAGVRRSADLPYAVDLLGTVTATSVVAAFVVWRLFKWVQRPGTGAGGIDDECQDGE